MMKCPTCSQEVPHDAADLVKARVATRKHDLRAAESTARAAARYRRILGVALPRCECGDIEHCLSCEFKV